MKITEPEQLYRELQQLDHDIKLLLLSKRFNHQMLELRKKFDIPEDGFKDNKSEEAKKDEYTKAELAELQHELYKVIDEFKELTARWFQSLRWYLFQNKPGVFMSRPSYELKLDGDPNNPQDIQCAWIKVDADTDIRAVTEAYHAAKEYLPKQGIKKPIIYIDDAILGKKLKSSNTTWKKVAEQVEKITKHRYDENRIRQLVNTLNKRIP